MVERTTPKIPIELAWDEYVASMEGRLHGQTDAFKFAWKAAKKEWVGLTDEEATKVYAEIQEKVDEHWNKGGTTMMFPPTLYKAIEAKLKELNT